MKLIKLDTYLKTHREMISFRGLTDHTLTSYCTYIRAYLEYLEAVLDKKPEDVSWQEMRDFILYIQDERSLSDRTINHCISQLRFFTEFVLHQPWESHQLPMRKFDAYLPYVPSKKETLHFISTMPDLKVKAMTTLLYSSGLRIGEVCHLKYQDVSRQDMRIYISRAKNRSARYAILSKNALDILTDYWRAYNKPKGWLFPKQRNSEKPIDTYFLLRHIHAHQDFLGLERRISCHTFRRAFGTHLYENGTDLLTIQRLMGHRSFNSVTIYVQLARNGLGGAVSPFDLMGGDSNGAC